MWYRVCGAMLLFVSLAVSFAPIPGPTFGTLAARLDGGPDPNTYTTAFQMGLVLPWFHGTYSAGPSGSRLVDGAFHAVPLLVHLLLPVVAACMLWLDRGVKPPSHADAT